VIDYILDRLEEPSTWRGFIALVTAIGITLTPEQTEAIVSGGLALIGLFGMFTKDKI
jgi:hypothetical protein